MLCVSVLYVQPAGLSGRHLTVFVIREFFSRRSPTHGHFELVLSRPNTERELLHNGQKSMEVLGLTRLSTLICIIHRNIFTLLPLLYCCCLQPAWHGEMNVVLPSSEQTGEYLTQSQLQPALHDWSVASLRRTNYKRDNVSIVHSQLLKHDGYLGGKVLSLSTFMDHFYKIMIP